MRGHISVTSVTGVVNGYVEYSSLELSDGTFFLPESVVVEHSLVLAVEDTALAYKADTTSIP